MAYDAKRERIVMFGGGNVVTGITNETWEWDGKAWTLMANFGPLLRHNHASVYNPDCGRVLIFGGEDDTDDTNSKIFADPWEWNGKGWTELPDFGPAPRRHTALAYDSVRKRTILFGGSDQPGMDELLVPKDKVIEPDPRTWEWDGTGWSVRATNGPRPRYGHAMAFDSARGRVVLFGGGYEEFTKGKKPEKINRYLGDTWEWDGRAWTQVSDIGPAPRIWHSMAYDPERGRMVLFSGQIADPTKSAAEVIPTDTWEWDGHLWSQVANIGPGHWMLAGLAYDIAHHQMVLFGGVGKGANESIWIWTP